MLTLLIPLGVLLFVLGVWLWRRGKRDRAGRVGWPSTSGAVDSSGVTVSKGDSDSVGSDRRFAAYYSYSVAGTPHRSYVFSDKARNHKALLAKYPVGAAVQLFYDPAKPAHSEIRDPLVLPGGWVDAPYQLGAVLIPGGVIVALVGLMLRYMGE
jgi:hypothetical protein